MKILVLNSGSSSQKSCLYEIGETIPKDPPVCLWEGKVEWTDDQTYFAIKNSSGVAVKDKTSVNSRVEAIERLLQTLWEGKTRAISDPAEIDVVGHRVVHGGPQHFEPAVVTAEVKNVDASGIAAYELTIAGTDVRDVPGILSVNRCSAIPSGSDRCRPTPPLPPLLHRRSPCASVWRATSR